ncbi:serine carboxypeptidase-like protein [Cucurbitaria berberidis CBS 394.84]|uniref:Carboxypeptidase n=1 Tax=Cucurbitaria berberidis CBS 394.84 TaxID=1168544 RepID=A0A9P4GMH1_9PLEO|nr:serine carboxypeptidase-like protein [Cucurbitaria berberidis CBS 394.84]KAF1849123.1 serine carboxypeptidase-like protein [Cucurbitaria berberidis CBS 394.84]
MKLLTLFGTLLCASSAFAGNSPHKRNVFNKVKPVLEKRVANEPFRHPELQKRASSFLTDKTKPFAVNGTGIPEVPFDIGESYAGLLPISDNPDETRKLFFWFFPSTLSSSPEEVVIWLNGGPGCSSLSGFLTENGPFTWESGTLAPVQNPYSWNNLTNVLWVEQPVGVGYSQGTPNITDEVELATEFRGFYKSFVDLFELYNWKTYVTGESYAGYYVPYIADGFIQANDTKYFNLAGISINDPIIGDETIQQQVIILPYVEYWQNLLFLNDSFMDTIRQHQKDCGYSEYLDTYFKFPPPQGAFPVLPDPSNSPNVTCDQFDNFYEAILAVNPCFNIYHITETCPHPFSQLGIVNTGDYSPPGAVIYFNRTDVKEALHADVNSHWLQCTDTNVFGNGNDSSHASDASPGPANNGVLQRVIEFTNNTIIGSGDLDMLLSTNGTLFAIQNMTWNGAQGLHDYPSTPLYAPYHPEYNLGALAGSGVQGVWTQERGLVFYTARLAGHELPGYTPGVAFRMLEILLGRVKDFSSTENFVTQSGNFTGTGTIY